MLNKALWWGGSGGVKHSVVRAKHSIVRAKHSESKVSLYPSPPESVVIWSKFPTRYPGFASQRSFLRKTNKLYKYCMKWNPMRPNLLNLLNTAVMIKMKPK